MSGKPRTTMRLVTTYLEEGEPKYHTTDDIPRSGDIMPVFDATQTTAEVRAAHREFEELLERLEPVIGLHTTLGIDRVVGNLLGAIQSNAYAQLLACAWRMTDVWPTPAVLLVDQEHPDHPGNLE